MNLGNVTEVESLIKSGASVNFTDPYDRKEETTVHWAVGFAHDENMRKNRYKILELLIKHGASLNGRNNEG